MCTYYLKKLLSVKSIFFSILLCDFFQILRFIHYLPQEYYCIMEKLMAREEKSTGPSYDFAIKEQYE